MEEWEKVMPDYIEKSGKHYFDFNKRIACIRELYEECNLLISENDLSDQVKLQTYVEEYQDKFP